MPTIESLLKKAKQNPDGIKFHEICRLAEAFGFERRKGKGSHKIYTRKGFTRILNFQNERGKAKGYQVRQFLDALDELGTA